MGFGSYGNTNGRNPHHEYAAKDPECAVSKWSKWSPCSRPCGPGSKRRTRLYKRPFVENRSCPIRLIERQSCYGQDQNCGGSDSASGVNYYSDYASSDSHSTYSNFDADYDIVSDVGNGIAIQTLDDTDDVEMVDNEIDNSQFNHRGLFEDDSDSTDDGLEGKEDEVDDICVLEMDPGTCPGQGHFKRWYFNKESESCKQFSFNGCLGNDNNFASKEQCEAKCGAGDRNDGGVTSYSWGGSNSGSPALTSPESNLHANIKWVEGQNDWNELERFSQPSRIHDMDSLSLVKISQPEERFRPVRRGGAPPKIDCQVSAWSQWTECSVSCGTGWTTRRRNVLISPGNGGRTCPKKMDRKKKCRQMPCPANTNYWYQGNWRHLTYDE